MPGLSSQLIKSRAVVSGFIVYSRYAVLYNNRASYQLMGTSNSSVHVGLRLNLVILKAQIERNSSLLRRFSSVEMMDIALRCLLMNYWRFSF